MLHEASTYDVMYTAVNFSETIVLMRPIFVFSAQKRAGESC